jgi:hypothetical protein
MSRKLAVLLGSLMVAAAPWGMSLESLGAALEAPNLFALVGIVGGVLLAWLGDSPVRPMR